MPSYRTKITKERKRGAICKERKADIRAINKGRGKRANIINHPQSFLFVFPSHLP
jgi:hypothetical protein